MRKGENLFAGDVRLWFTTVDDDRSRSGMSSKLDVNGFHAWVRGHKPGILKNPQELFCRNLGPSFASFRSRNGEARRIAEKFQGGGHANAAGALLPKSVRTVEEGVVFLRTMLNAKHESGLNNLESLFSKMEFQK